MHRRCKPLPATSQSAAPLPGGGNYLTYNIALGMEMDTGPVFKALQAYECTARPKGTPQRWRTRVACANRATYIYITQNIANGLLVITRDFIPVRPHPFLIAWQSSNQANNLPNPITVKK